MLYSRKGDDGNTSTFNCAQKISKSASIIEALGALDEVNSFLGLCKIKAQEQRVALRSETTLETIMADIQNTLFIIQAELAGFSETISEDHVLHIEEVTNCIEKELPRIKNFVVAGGSELSALFDIARTLARKAERRICSAIEENEMKVGPHTRAYLNRISSILYACARLANHRAGAEERRPNY